MSSSYVSGTLMKNENILVSFNPHPIILAAPIICLLLSAAFVMYGPQIPYIDTTVYGRYTIFNLLIFVFFAYSICKLISRIVDLRTSEYTATNYRVVMKRGVLNKVALEMMLDRIEAISVQQTLPGQLFNYGDITLMGIGGTRDNFTFVPKPAYFRQQVQNMKQQRMENEQNQT